MSFNNLYPNFNQAPLMLKHQKQQPHHHQKPPSLPPSHKELVNYKKETGQLSYLMDIKALNDKVRILKIYIAQAHDIIEDLKKANARQRAMLRNPPPNIPLDIFLGCAFGLLFVVLIKMVGIKSEI